MSAENSCSWYDLGCHLGWIMDEIRLFFVWIAEQIFNGMISLLDAIPIPEWAQQGVDVMGFIPPGVGYFLAPLNLGAGLAILSSAYGVRFLIRRIPLIG